MDTSNGFEIKMHQNEDNSSTVLAAEKLGGVTVMKLKPNSLSLFMA